MKHPRVLQWLKHAAMLPWHMAALLTGEKDFSRNPVLGSPVLNAWGLHVARKRLAHALCQRRRRQLQKHLPAEWVTAYQARGVVVVPNFLTPVGLEALCEDIAKLQQTAIEMEQPPALTRRFNLDRDTCAAYPALTQLLDNRPLFDLLRYAAGYAGAPIVAVQCIHTDAGAGRHDPQTDWHVDTFHSTAKAWLFLHDVGEDEGPFAYVPGSHAPTPARLGWEKRQSETAAQHPNRLHAKGSFRATPAELKAMGYGNPLLAAVNANTLVVADTSGFHRRTPSPARTLRVEIYLSLRRDPYWSGLRPSLLGLPGLRRGWAEMALNIYRWRVRMGLASWRPAASAGLLEVERTKLRSLQPEATGKDCKG